MTVIYLLRHGQASFHADDYDALSELGHQQAEVVGEGMRERGIEPDAIMRGTMLRHQQTLQGVSQAFTAVPEANLSANWNEYDHQNILGVFDARLATPASTRAYLKTQPEPMKLFQQQFLQAMQQWTGRSHEGYSESWQDFQQRVMQGWQQILQTEGKTRLVVTSGGPISLITCHLLGLPAEQFMRINLTLVNTGLTKIVLRKSGKASLSVLNNHDIFQMLKDPKWITYS